MTRSRWLNLNGNWGFCQDPEDRGLQDAWYLLEDFEQTIVVPFCVESEASGVHDTQPARVVWYSRTFEVPDGWGPRVVLRIGASDHWTRIYVNGHRVADHRGGYSPFWAEVGHVLVAGTNRVTIRVADSLSWTQPRGKQAGTTRWPIDYESVTGIWQTVWLEPLPNVSVEGIGCSYSLEDSTLDLLIELSEQFDGQVEVTVVDPEGVTAGKVTSSSKGRAECRLTLKIEAPLLWSPESPHLYELEIRLLDNAGSEMDRVESYAGLREVTVAHGRLHLNGGRIYLRGVLDQGYFPDGWYTAISDEQLRQDVELTLAMGFNFARKHQKAEDPRYLYWADKLGLMVWAEMPSGRIFSTELVTTLTEEWMQLVRRDRGHPSVIGWVPFNESWGVWNQAQRPEQRAFVDALVCLTKAMDQSRPVVGNDGWEYSSGDLWTLHLYEGEGDDRSIAERLRIVVDSPHVPLNPSGSQMAPRVGALPGADVKGLPVLLTECGGVGFVAESREDAFAYGDLPQDIAALERRVRAVAEAVSESPMLCGFVWTQLTDVQQEINGLLYFDRSPKLPMSVLNEIFSLR